MMCKKSLMSLFGVVFLVGLTGCCMMQKQKISPVDLPAQMTVSIPKAQQINMSGNFSVKLYTGAKTDSVILQGYHSDLQKVFLVQRDAQLNVWEKEPLKQSVTLSIYVKRLTDLTISQVKKVSIHSNQKTPLSMRFEQVGDLSISGNNRLDTLTLIQVSHISVPGNIRLSHLVYNNDALLNINNFHSNDLTIVQQGNGQIILRGGFNVSNINQNGGSLDLRWVKSKTIDVTAKGDGQIKLAGVADELNVDLNNNVKLDAQFLRTQNVKIKTDGYAEAKIFPQNILIALVTGSSEVAYMGTPKHLDSMLKYYGVLRQMS